LRAGAFGWRKKSERAAFRRLTNPSAFHIRTTSGFLPPGAFMPKPKTRENPAPEPVKASVAAVAPADRTAELAGKIKELVRLANEQGHLTFDDISEALTGITFHAGSTGPIVRQTPRTGDRRSWIAAEWTRQTAAGRRRGIEARRLRRAGRPGADVSQADGRGAAADARAGSGDFQAHREGGKRTARGGLWLWFAGKEHLALAEKLLAEPPRERFDRVVLDKQVASRDAHLKTLHKLVAQTRELDAEVDRHFNLWRDAHQNAKRNREHDEFSSSTKNCRRCSRNSVSSRR
jgi:hypothetical protein